MRARIVAVGVVLGRVVGVEERPPVEEQPAGPGPPADDADGVGRVPPLRPDLGQVLGPPLDVLPGRRRATRSAGPTRTAGPARGRPGRTPPRSSRRAASNSARCDSGIRSSVGERDRPRCRCCASRRRTRCRPGWSARAAASRPRTRGSLRIWAMARPFGPPRAPPHAPQSWADSCGLFMLVDPCPSVNTSRAKPAVSPMSRSTRSAMAVISSRVNPTWPPSGPGVGSRPLQPQPGPRRACGRTGRRAARTRAVSRGNRVRATSGTDASTPRAADEDRPGASAAGCRRGPGATPPPRPAGSGPQSRCGVRQVVHHLLRRPSASGCITAGQSGTKWASAAPR